MYYFVKKSLIYNRQELELKAKIHKLDIEAISVFFKILNSIAHALEKNLLVLEPVTSPILLF